MAELRRMVDEIEAGRRYRRLEWVLIAFFFLAGCAGIALAIREFIGVLPL